MIDYSKIKTIDELEYQTQRLQRRAAIQRSQLEGHIQFVVREYQHLVHSIDAVLTPVRNAINEYRSAYRVVSRIVKAFIPKKK